MKDFYYYSSVEILEVEHRNTFLFRETNIIRIKYYKYLVLTFINKTEKTKMYFDITVSMNVMWSYGFSSMVLGLDQALK